MPDWHNLFYFPAHMKQTAKAFLFDYGGTLDTAARHWAHVLWDGYLGCRIPVAQAAFREAYVHGERALAKSPIILPEDNFLTLLVKKLELQTTFLRDNGAWSVSEAERQSAITAVAQGCDAYVRRNIEQVRPVLDRLRANHRFVLVSNFYGNLPSVLRDYGLAKYFPVIVESAVVGVRKPHPDIYRLAVEAAGCLPEECIAVGDSYPKDIVPAKHVGCRAVWFKGEEWETQTYDETLPDAVITEFKQLLDL